MSLFDVFLTSPGPGKVRDSLGPGTTGLYTPCLRSRRQSDVKPHKLHEPLSWIINIIFV